MISSSYQFLPLLPVFSCPFEWLSVTYFPFIRSLSRCILFLPLSLPPSSEEGSQAENQIGSVGKHRWNGAEVVLAVTLCYWFHTGSTVCLAFASFGGLRKYVSLQGLGTVGNRKGIGPIKQTVLCFSQRFCFRMKTTKWNWLTRVFLANGRCSGFGDQGRVCLVIFPNLGQFLVFPSLL